MRRMAFVGLLLGLSTLPALGDVPQTINHQGVIEVNGVPFNGMGHFKFAILNAASVNVWTNDGSNLVFDGEPSASETVTVTDGVYNVLLGGSGPAYGMEPISPAVFNGTVRKLRVWFNDGVHGFEKLQPDQELSSSPYAHQTPTIPSPGQPPIGSIVAWHKNFANTPALPIGGEWVECDGNPITTPGSPYLGQLTPDLNGGNSARFLRGGPTSGTMQGFTLQGHEHSVHTDWGTELLGAIGGGTGYWGSNVSPRDPSVGNSYKAQEIIEGDHGPPQVANETRPINMSVVWIMRVK